METTHQSEESLLEGGLGESVNQVDQMFDARPQIY